jgi:hypothetical protein
MVYTPPVHLPDTSYFQFATALVLLLKAAAEIVRSFPQGGSKKIYFSEFSTGRQFMAPIGVSF